MSGPVLYSQYRQPPSGQAPSLSDHAILRTDGVYRVPVVKKSPPASV